jgi:hypothetical protein
VRISGEKKTKKKRKEKRRRGTFSLIICQIVGCFMYRLFTLVGFARLREAEEGLAPDSGGVAENHKLTPVYVVYREDLI